MAAITKIYIKRDFDRRSANQGNPRGVLVFRTKIEGQSLVGTTQYEWLLEEEFKKLEEKGIVQALRFSFVTKNDAFIIEYPTDLKSQTVIDKLKYNFVQKLLKAKEFRLIEDVPTMQTCYTIEFTGRIALKKAARIRSISLLINQVNAMSKQERMNALFMYAPHLQPSKMTNSELYIALVDITTDPLTGMPKGELINSHQRIEAFTNDYYTNKEDSTFRVTINKSIEYGIVESRVGRYYIQSEFVGVEREDVYAYLKAHLDIYEGYVLPQIALKDPSGDEDDMLELESNKTVIIDESDISTYTIERLQEVALNMGIKAVKKYDKDTLLKKVKAIAEANRERDAEANSKVAVLQN